MPSLLDANIWLYAFIEAQDERKHSIAKKLIGTEEVDLSVRAIRSEFSK